MERTYIDDIPEYVQDGVMPTWVADEDIIEEEAVPESTALALVPEERPRSVLRMLSHAGALAWRQPVVRAAVRTGASAVALSVALRMAGRLVTSRNLRRAATASAAPDLVDLLRPGKQRTLRRGRSVEVSETFIYMRRITRR